MIAMKQDDKIVTGDELLDFGWDLAQDKDEKPEVRVQALETLAKHYTNRRVPGQLRDEASQYLREVQAIAKKIVLLSEYPAAVRLRAMALALAY